MPKSQTVFITGASAGIGAGLAREYARRGARLALLARRTERLESLAAELRALGAEVSIHQGDVTREGDVSRALDELAARTDYARAHTAWQLRLATPGP